MAVRKRNARWYVGFRYKDPVTGQSKRFKRSTGRTTATRREAEKTERQWYREVTTPPDPVDERKHAAFSGFAKHWYELHVKTNCKRSYQRSTERELRVHLVPFFGDVELRKITIERIEQYKAAKVSTGLSPKTVNNHLGVLSSLFSVAVRWKYAEVNPLTQVRRLKLPPQEFRFWDRQQSDAFLRARGSRTGTHLSNPCIWKPMKRATQAAGLPKIAFHDLRHSFASQLVMEGVPLVAVQQYLGHADLKTTMRYAHLSPAEKHAYVERLDGAWSHSGPSRGSSGGQRIRATENKRPRT